MSVNFTSLHFNKTTIGFFFINIAWCIFNLKDFVQINICLWIFIVNLLFSIDLLVFCSQNRFGKCVQHNNLIKCMKINLFLIRTFILLSNISYI